MDDLPVGRRTCLYDPEHMVEIIDQMSCKAAALLHESKNLAIIGVLRRGAPLANKLTDLLVHRYGFEVPLRLDISVKRYADDLTLLYPQTNLRENDDIASIDLAGYTLLIVDDVLYTGNSLFKVVEYLIKKGPKEIYIACLVDRKINTLPIKAEIIGIDLQIAYGDVVECHIPPYESEFQIQLLQLDDAKLRESK